MTRKLRRWQAQCVRMALKQYAVKKHFFCQATPGAGKTRMAAELASELLSSGKIDLIICFAPTCQVVSSIQKTFEKVLNKPMNGLVGAVGAVLTYAAMDHLKSSFWKLFEKYRILIIFDEIHHCAGSETCAGNVWGEKILEDLQDRALYTLSISGTPWRSDERPIALARYCSEKGRLICDYQYGLKQAIKDEVCRMPKIVLLDNGEIILTERDMPSDLKRSFSSIATLLRETTVTYERLIFHEDLAIQLLQLGIAKLKNVQKNDANAAGLIVATNIEHANRIAHLLIEWGETCSVVTNDTPDAQRRIDEFRINRCHWIIAVGMISEGTDIQRLQVCCYLSRIRTELHFRQVLGRVLRHTGRVNESGWLFALAEPSLKEYSIRIAEDLPEVYDIVNYAATNGIINVEPNDDIWLDEEDLNISDMDTADSQSEQNSDGILIELVSPKHHTLTFSKNYWHEVLSTY